MKTNDDTMERHRRRFIQAGTPIFGKASAAAEVRRGPGIKS